MVEVFDTGTPPGPLGRNRIYLLASLVLAGASILCVHRTWAQSYQLVQRASTNPVLHRRSESDQLDAVDTISHGRTTLPLDVSGEYSLGQMGELVEIDLQESRLSGYITRNGDRESDEGAPLTFMFATSALNGTQLSFTTRQVHGVSFSFTGTIVRGSAQSRAEAGYYRLQGRLVRHDAVNRTDQSRDVSLPLTRVYTNG
jgi:hypothetical protein